MCEWTQMNKNTLQMVRLQTWVITLKKWSSDDANNVHFKTMTHSEDICSIGKISEYIERQEKFKPAILMTQIQWRNSAVKEKFIIRKTKYYQSFLKWTNPFPIFIKALEVYIKRYLSYTIKINILCVNSYFILLVEIL